MIGETLGSYTIVDRIGAGGMGEVYLAQHTRIDRRAAIKVLLPHMSSNQDVVNRFFAEARATSSIRHKGIVEVLDCDVHASGRAYIVMELLEGESLASRLAHDPDFGRDVGRVLEVARAVAEAVGTAHRKGIVHRDLKPDNIFLANDPSARFGFVVKILDFGIAKLLGGEADDGERPGSVKTRTGSLMGTPAYMSPEQCRGASQVDHRTDIYSLGCIVYEMLAGRPPFVFEGFGELISAHLHLAPPPLGSLGIAVPAAVETWMGLLLAKSPDERFATMADVLGAARRLEGDPGALAGRVAALRPAPSAVPTLPRQTTTFSDQAAEKVESLAPRSFPLKALAIGFGVAGVVAGAFFLIRGRTPVGLPAPAAGWAGGKAAPPVAAPAVERISIAVSDPPDGLSALLDGKPQGLPLELPRGPAVHELVFKAPGYQDRVLRLDASTSRVVTLAMQRADPPAAQRPAAEPATLRPSPAAPAAPKKPRPRRPSIAVPEGDDDARKL